MATIRKRTWTTKKGEARTSWIVDFTDTSGNRQRRQFDDHDEAQQFRIDINYQMRAGTFQPESGSVTVADAANIFLKYCERRMKHGERMTRQMFVTYAGHVHNYICPDAEIHLRNQRFRETVFFRYGIGRVKLESLTARVVCDFRDNLRDAGLAVASVRKILGTLKLILSYAVNRDLIAVNAAQTVKVISRRADDARRVAPPSKSAMRRLIAVAEGDFRVTLMFAAMTGVRASEQRALRWRHIDFFKGEVKIETRVDGYGEEDVTKTKAGMRAIPLGEDLVRELQALQMRSKWGSPDDLVFPNEKGRYLNHDNLAKRKFAPLFEKLAKLHAQDPATHPPAPPRFNWHALRHFAISCWIEAGLPIKAVQTFAGHSSVTVTMDRYGHLFRSDDHRTAMSSISRQFSVEEPTRSDEHLKKPRGKPKEPEP